MIWQGEPVGRALRVALLSATTVLKTGRTPEGGESFFALGSRGFLESLDIGHSYVQQGIELGPNLIFLGAGHMAKRAFLLRSHFGSWSFWLMMIEIVVPPSAGIGIAIGILDGRIAIIERSGEIASPRRLGSRTVGILPRQRELQVLEHDCPFGKCKRLLVYLVLARFDVDVV